MERLILLRHGKAERESSSGDDFGRRLTPRGQRESAAMAETLAEMGFSPDVALVSGAARTCDTWAAAQDCFPKAEARFEDALYLAEAGVVRRFVDQAGEAKTVLVVGHNPGLQELAVKLLVEGGAPRSLISKAQSQFPTAAAAVFIFDHDGRPAFDGLFFPSDRR